jgi:hypothetical protein
MIGTDLNLDLPLAGESMATFRSKTATALSAIEDSFADKVTPAGMDITTNLSFGGNHATNVGGIILTDGNTPYAEGSVYYAGGSFYMRDATGDIKLTLDGALNVSAVGAIGGNYGEGDESLNYDAISQEYRLRASDDEWADAVLDDVVLMEVNGTDYVRLSAPAAVSASYTVTFPTGVPSEQACLQMGTDGTLVASNELNSIESITLDSGGSVMLSGSGDVKHGDKTFTFPVYTNAQAVSGSLSYQGDAYAAGLHAARLSSGGAAHIQIPYLRTGWRIKQVYLGSLSGSSLANAKLEKQTNAAITTLKSTEAKGANDYISLTLGTPHTVVAGDFIRVVVNAGTGLDMLTCVVTYDIP